MKPRTWMPTAADARPARVGARGTWGRALLVVLLCAAGLSQHVRAQAIRGTVYIAEEQRPVADVVIRITGEADFEVAATSRSDGSFLLLVPGAGRYFITAERIGLKTLDSTAIDVPARGAVEISVTMSAQAVELSGLVVVAQRRNLSQTELIAERVQSARALGLGRTMTREEIEERRAPHTAALINSAAPHVRIRRGPQDANTVFVRDCPLAVYVDGVLINRQPTNVNFIVNPQDLLAVEVYRGASQMRDYIDPRGCGTVLLWTKRGEDQSGSPITWLRIGVAAALLGILLLK
ncbi:MAG: carboxypeptidase regulatory-like domain-containing protein [Gemmatimonadetes bacterium]|nr:carboxypeptidase regulatory-like domain-containing protein [Gemmatimonadota bacterium]